MNYHLHKPKFLSLVYLRIKELEIELNEVNFDVYSIISIVLS